MSLPTTLQSKEVDFTPEQLKLIRDTVAKGANDDEMRLFLYRCKIMGFNPLIPGQIHFIKYGGGAATIVVGIEGFRARAQSTGKMSGVERELIRDAQGKCIGARAKVYRKDWERPAVMEVSIAEYSTGKGPWAKMPETMIGKVAEAAALRMAFPDQLGGVYTKEEMDQAEKNEGNGPGKVFPDQPGPDDGDQTPTEYRIPFGQWRGMTPEYVYSVHKRGGPEGIKKYIEYLERQCAEQNKPMRDEVVSFIEVMSDLMAFKENEIAEQVKQ